MLIQINKVNNEINTMYSLSVFLNGSWRIKKDGKLVLNGIGTATEAALIAKQNGIVLSQFNPKKKVA